MPLYAKWSTASARPPPKSAATSTVCGKTNRSKLATIGSSPIFADLVDTQLVHGLMDRARGSMSPTQSTIAAARAHRRHRADRPPTSRGGTQSRRIFPPHRPHAPTVSIRPSAAQRSGRRYRASAPDRRPARNSDADADRRFANLAMSTGRPRPGTAFDEFFHTLDTPPGTGQVRLARDPASRNFCLAIAQPSPSGP